MTIPTVSPERFRAALEEFDHDVRSLPEWEGWTDDKKHKYGIVEGEQVYPVKKIISLATGLPVSGFSGGPEAVTYVRKLGFSLQALRLPPESEIKAALHDLLLDSAPSPVEPADAYEKLARHFGLSRTLRSLPLPSGENHFENRVRQARRKLVDAGILDGSTRGAWALASRSQPKVWVEKTDVKGEAHRAEGDFAFSKRLWSPTRAEEGADVYANMRLVQPGDRVMHLVDGQRFMGVSQVAERAQLDATCPSGSKWAGRPAYTIELEGYVELSPPLEREEFLKDASTRPALATVLARYDKLFFNKDFDLNQGAYLTEAPTILVDVLNNAYTSKTGAALPLVGTGSKASSLVQERFDAARKLFTWIYGEEAFSSSRYLEEERAYKEELSREWRANSTEEDFREALNSSSPEQFAVSLVEPLLDSKRSNFLPWRYSDTLKALSRREYAITFLEATQNLLFGGRSDAPDVDGFNAALLPLYSETLNDTAVKPASHVIPSLMLWLQEPNEQFLVRPEIYNRLADCLLGAPPEGQGSIMSTAYYLSAVTLAKELLTQLRPEGARDLIDVQGFAWGVFRHAGVWFGGKSYGGHVDMLPEFRRRGVYAIGFREAGDRTSLLSDADQLTKIERDERKKLIDESGATAGEKKAFTAFLDLASAPGSIILAKSIWYDRKVGGSLLRISAVGLTENGYQYDPQVGHMLPTSWRSVPELTVEATAHFHKISGTLTRIPLRDTLDILSSPALSGREEQTMDAAPEVESVITPDEPLAPVESQPRYTREEFLRETGFTAEQLSKLERQLRRKRQLVLQGPPGTGKTFVAERLARLLVSETTGQWSVVQFHPSYSYEDFMQGIRPKLVDGSLAFELESGRFLDFCKDAARASNASPFLLLIDEINRADLSRVFGELMYLLEYRDKDIPLASGTPFHIPDNVFLVGTMNTADRSIALVDHALRRRFTFLHLGPEYDVLRAHLAAHGLPADSLIEVLKTLNGAIDDKNYEVGISFFMKDGAALPAALPDIWEGEIEPYLEEFFFDQPAKVDPFRWSKLSKTQLSGWTSTGPA